MVLRGVDDTLGADPALEGMGPFRPLLSSMLLSLMIYDSEGRTRGSLKLQVTRGSTLQWTVAEDTVRLWPKIGFSQSGPVTLNGTEVLIMDQPPGKVSMPVVRLSDVPARAATAGTGSILAPSDASLAGGNIFWIGDPKESSEMTEVRKVMRQVLDKWVPVPVMDSNNPAFKMLTGYNTKRLLDEYWEPENKNPPYEPGKMPKKNTGFTCCNLTLGALAIQLGAALGRPPGVWLTRGVLALYLVDKDVPGCWIKPDGTNRPKPGDFYSVPLTLEDGTVQQYGHVGVVYDILDDTWMSVDGGQGGYRSGPKLDRIKRQDRGKLDTSRMNGWIDIDLYWKK